MAFASCAPSGSGSSFGVTPGGSYDRQPSKVVAPVIYVANKAGEPKGGTVTVYTATGRWLRTMHKGITAPTMLAFDTLHDVYVLNAPSKGGGSVAVFSRGGKKFLGRIANKAIKSPTGLALDSKNNIYVLNAASSTGKGNVLEFAAGTSNLIATIVKGIAKPTQIASDCHGNVYVLNSGSKTVTAYGQKHKLNRTIHGMSAATGLMVTCPGNVYVSQSLVTAPEVRGRVPLSATPTPSPTPSSGPPTGTVTEFAAGSTTASLTITLTEGIPCDMAPNASDTTVFVMACPTFSSSGGGMTMLAYPMDMSTSQLTINLGVTFDMFTAFAPIPGVIQQETLALARTGTSSPDALGTHSGSYNNMQLEIVGITYASSSSSGGAYNVVGVDEPTMGDPVAIVSN